MRERRGCQDAAVPFLVMGCHTALVASAEYKIIFQPKQDQYPVWCFYGNDI